MKSIYLLVGENKQAIDEKIKELSREGNFDELNLVKYDSEEVTLDEIIADCETLPFLGEQKMVIIINPIFLSTEKSKLDQNIERFISYVNNPNPSTVLVINCCNIKLDMKRRITQLLYEKAQVLEFDNLNELEAEELIINYFQKRNVKVNYDVIQELIRRTECDAFRLYSELQKLSFYLENVTEITIDDIKALVTEPLEQDVFKLTGYFLDRRIDEALKVYQQLIIFHDPLVFLSILAKNFHYLYLIKYFQKQGLIEYQIKNLINIHPYQLKMLYPIALKTSENDIIKNIKAFHQYDIDLKTGKIDKILGFELLILNM